ncbi:hypothetical protein OBBRIDRAFT_799599 [Obba rivulosa]|uniref:Uncharacterized protein n=1 Tax=Obba rivulosa TaxID=1052685 RepID=A0A8E2AI18_9APHY|nr:hypothetical protein OBBRIDRAFT_799599 [Obba rivulosa]
MNIRACISACALFMAFTMSPVLAGVIQRSEDLCPPINPHGIPCVLTASFPPITLPTTTPATTKY